MSHYTLCAITQIESEEVYVKFEKLAQSNQDYVVDFFTEKLKKPLAKFDINNESSDAGKFDNWSIANVMSTTELLEHLHEFERMPDSILLPNLEWIQSEDVFYLVTETNQKDFNTWVNKFREIVSSYKNSLAVLIDCHI